LTPQVAAGPAQQGRQQQQRASVARLPFLTAAHQHTEFAQFDTTVTPTASTQQLGPFDIPAGGYFRNLWIQVDASGGTIGSAALTAILAPWNVFQQVTLFDVNGAQIYGPFPNGGYTAYLTNLFGGYDFVSDPAVDPDYAASAITINFLLKIPLEYHKSGRGALPNQDSSAKYKLSLTLNNIAAIWSVAPTLAPNLRIRGYLDAWTMPGPTDMAGNAQAQIPPGYGTTQFWSSYTTPLVVGQNIIPVRRVGNRIRGLYFAFYKAGVPATAAQMPDPIELDWDQRALHIESKTLRRARMSRAIEGSYASNVRAIPQHVLGYGFAEDMQGHTGGMGPELFLPTVQGTRLDGVFTVPASGADSVEVIMNDVAGAELDSGARYSEASITAFEPAASGSGTRGTGRS
jgi:hypothetical protein